VILTMLGGPSAQFLAERFGLKGFLSEETESFVTIYMLAVFFVE